MKSIREKLTEIKWGICSYCSKKPCNDDSGLVSHIDGDGNEVWGCINFKGRIKKIDGGNNDK